MSELRRISIAELDLDRDQPRTKFDQDELASLGQNMKAIGQQVPLIVYQADGKHVICDGARRMMAGQLAGFNELLCLVLPQKPGASLLRVMQMSLEAHKVGLSAWERSCFLRRIKEENGWSIAELASRLQMKQPLVSKLLACQRLDRAIQQLVHTGALDLEKAFIISQEPSVERQREMVKLYAHLPRDQFRQRAKPTADSEQATVKRARFYLPGGASVMVHGPALTLAGAIACLLETVKQLKRGQSQNQDIVATQKAMRQKARTSHVVVE